ncbi:MAG: Holliday junction DNA helicase RuvA [Spirochaetes bacterium GWF1_31_7]|nr:MAG: Holliday junction DNA helicase RuvA [Spirochaetes bacterium GWE1_32_154]OHD48405.1 MAG: Holliday junction DNA helicase RuvA [Spirochaetes bacterium GWE2_31_10]OHD50882.1 MAG: Holliday junction DNA helicase RuvA [Spirochaetes bacterium GWF1_31_7]OHD83071.1 MAG: Holliday junction DNA helicase RuvA [Spirochaetes bacterium RIFOXYB1_FULL_32_8]HBD96407.1 Holliday junction branch migration protein RuvA [Spirochaetia bacterium]
MYDHIQGKIDRVKDNTVILSTFGIGYILYLPLNDSAELSEMIGTEIKLFTHYIHKEDNVTLYGFIKEESRDGFRTLIKVDGVGPKTALAMLSRHDIGVIYQSIENESVDVLKKTPGIGEKTAKKMILDLKGTINLLTINNLNQSDSDLVSAMISMGYNKNDVLKIYEKGKPFSGVFSDDIKKLLKLMV